MADNSNLRWGHIRFVEIDHEIIYMVILPYGR